MNLIVDACMDIGCMCELTLVGISNPNGGKSLSLIQKEVRQGMPALFELGLMVNLFLNFNKGSLVLEPLESLFCFFTFCLKTTPGT
jgi:hypothetical protein